LPKPLTASLIPQRVKGIKAGKEENLEASTNALGISTALIETSYDQVKYSLQLPLLSAPIVEVNEQSYEHFKKQFVEKESQKEDFLKPLLSFDAETDFFLSELKGLPLTEKMEQIEQYVRAHAFYDMKNKEVNGLKY
jgi:hypothetical protein